MGLQISNIFKKGKSVFSSSSNSSNPRRNSTNGEMTVSQMMEELGVRGIPTIKSYNDEEINPDNLNIEDYIKMQNNDGTVKAITRLFAMPIQSTEVKVIPHENDSGEAKFIKNVFKNPQHEGGMNTPLSFVIADMTRAIFEGYRVYEKVPKVIESGEYEGLIGWKKIAPRDSRTVTIRTDDEGGFNGVTQRSMGGGKINEVEIPPEKCILFTFQKERHPFYGESILKTAYYHYDKKHKLYYLAHKKAEIDAVGIKMLNVQQNNSSKQVESAEQAVDSLTSNSRVTLPPGLDLNIDRSQSGYSVMPLIEHHDKQIMISTLTQAVNMGQQDSYNYPYGSGYDAQGKFINQMLNSVMRSIEDTLNQWAVAPLVDWNFGTGAYPQIKMMPLDQETDKMLMDIFQELISKKPEAVNSEFTQEVVDEVANKLGMEIRSKSVEEALKAFESGKREIFDSRGKPAAPTSEEAKKRVKEYAQEIEGDSNFLEKFEVMGKNYAQKHLT